MANMSDNANVYRKIEDGFDFILSHFQEPIFPRKVMTKGLGIPSRGVQ
jgi:hypothetical protein